MSFRGKVAWHTKKTLLSEMFHFSKKVINYFEFIVLRLNANLKTKCVCFFTNHSTKALKS